MVTDARGHEIPAGDDPWGYREDMELFSASIVDVRAVANQEAADALVADLEAGGVDPIATTCWVAATRHLIVYDGSEWQTVASAADVATSVSKLPVAMTAGWGTIPGVTGTKSQTITFPAGLFTVAPAVVAGPKTAFPQNRSAVSAQSATTTSVQIFIYYEGSATNLDYAWTAIQPDPPPESLLRALAEDGAPVADAVVTCTTAGCENQNIPIQIPSTWTDEDGTAHPVDDICCGVCGADLTASLAPIEGS